MAKRETMTGARGQGTNESPLLEEISSRFRINPYTGTHLRVGRAHGPFLETDDGRRLIDVFMAHGSAMLGHAEPRVLDAVRAALDAGVVAGYETGIAQIVAARLVEAVPSAERVRFVASGSEAVLTAIRLARAYTGRQVIVKIDGQFNGTADYVLYNSVAAYADAANPGGRASALLPFSSGLPADPDRLLCALPWNDLPALEAAFDALGDQIAAVVMVPIDYNNGCLMPARGYLEAVRELTRRRGCLLVFDEVLSGFKTGLSCAQGLLGVTPDLTTLSKALSNGVPFSALVGRAEIMALLAAPLPRGVIQGGTFAGNAI
ncbi:MAG: aminotransferase class III-fold pyridoxal phosphate-dependent enzyme, partial [Alphaproteobacteria bacterium]|nr:aminotransferase class III-fold pyridoxal phosphate-dependent enzyme [Alphaproteobacteria bacterium]